MASQVRLITALLADVEELEVVVGEGFAGTRTLRRIAHIRAASALGPRYDEAMTDEDRRAFDNLVLLCLPTRRRG